MPAGRWREQLGKGETVCLLMPNRPEYLAVWLGIIAPAASPRLINTNLIGPSLAHCIDIVTPKHIIVAAELRRKLRHRPATDENHGRRSGRTAKARTVRPRIDRAVDALARRRASPPPNARR